MSPFAADLAVTMEYLHTATDLHMVVCGAKGQDWHAKVRGTDPEDGAVIGVAFYDMTYEFKADATKRARELLAHVKALRKAA